MADKNIKFPTMDEFAKEVAEKSLDGILYDGRSIREWMQIIASEDCISRQAVLEIANSSKSNWIDNSVLFKRVNKLPPVTPKPKTGHWIEHEHNGILHIECSECSTWFLRAHLLRNSYCPNCGKKMESEDKR